MKRDRNVFPGDSICQVAQMHAIAFNSKCICISLLMFNLTEKILEGKKDSIDFWYFVIKIVLFCYQNCSDLL